MGLDMYLYRKSRLNNFDFYKPEFRHEVTIKSGSEAIQINSEKVRIVIEEIAYWRKENHIHKWFVDNIQSGNDDCGYYPVTIDQLAHLLSLCEAVVKKEKEPSALPTQGGFFFGGTEYDEYYFKGCEKTIQMISAHLKDTESEFFYTSSW